MLLASGLVMFTLWFSKKAHRVIQTSINLAPPLKRVVGRSSSGASLCRPYMIVRAAVSIGTVINRSCLGSLLTRNRQPTALCRRRKNFSAFDYVAPPSNLDLSPFAGASATGLQYLSPPPPLLYGNTGFETLPTAGTQTAVYKFPAC